MAAAPSTRAMREKITFDPNIPVTVAFEFPSQEGQQQENRNGEMEYRYFLHGNKIMWLPAAAEAALRKHGEPAGVTITKVKKGNGVAWLVQPTEEEPAIAQQLEQSIANAKATTEARARAQLAPAAPYGQAGLHEPPDWKAQQHPRKVTRAAARIAAALCSAIDAAIEAEAYAARRGFALKLSSSDIRALANCSEIGEQR